MSQAIEEFCFVLFYLREKLLVKIMAKLGGTKDTFEILINVICVDIGGSYRTVHSVIIY